MLHVHSRSQIEKEALALVFSAQKFHKMIHGSRFLLRTDHKPLLAIFGSRKGMSVYTANRQQRWATTLLRYDFKLKYRPSENMGHADGLSRLIARNPSDNEDIIVSSVEAEMCQVFQDTCRALPVTAQMVKEASTNDPLIKKVKQAMLKCWKAGNTKSEFYQFYLRRDSLSIYDDCLMFSERLVIPASLHQPVLKQFHVGHPGRSRMKSIVRSYVYWPFIDKHVEDYVARCSRCASAAKKSTKK